jgi:hypothetical protein
MRAVVTLGVTAFLGWLIYFASPIQECRSIARILDDGAEVVDGSGIRWGLRKIIECTVATRSQRTAWGTDAIMYKFSATIARERRVNPQAQ